ncbi:MAG: response regulator, partial [Candidatus Zixiibacteriota bacterium]
VEAEYVTNGADALVRMREKTFDVIVLDLKLPGMAGEDVLNHIKREHPQVPVLMITGHGSPANEPGKMPEGAFDFLAKPINLEDLMKKMQEAIRGI